MSGMWKRHPREHYRWFTFDSSLAWATSFLFTLLAIALSIFLFTLYIYSSDDLAPDSFAGYTYGIIGTLFILLAALSYTRQRRSRKRGVGQLNASLHWHVSFGLVALAFLLLHSFGHFNSRTGTYALYGMIALVLSGMLGRFLTRTVPKLIAHEVQYIHTDQGKPLANVQRALRREEYYRAMLSYWRICHIVLAFVTLGLTLWHLEYAATLLIPTFFRPLPL